ncbi:MAG: hypothetical protein KKF46_07705 [Nanoarchaeota archaeon]|nr:hypothetical protein [Nanoarchaeota archaeon]MBU1322213.1 hypothetical protein [Nanoarchaeota archaeon]MBU1597754.1 hypothetical protein [Nanoarchaeota archaeon]MBU2442018.1 hypothetical protein [Nanoarchaeota archaeon]
MEKKLETLLQEGDVIRFTKPLRVTQDKKNSYLVNNLRGREITFSGEYVVEESWFAREKNSTRNTYVWHIKSRKLGINHVYSPRNQEMNFIHYTGIYPECFDSAINKTSMEVIGTMRKKFVDFEEL